MRHASLACCGSDGGGLRLEAHDEGARTAPRPGEPHAQTSPYEAGTWIAKLDDARESERAVTELEQLGAPDAGEGKPQLAELGVETTIVRNYFMWAK